MSSEPYSEEALLDDLRSWWDDEVGDGDPFADPKQASGTIFDVIPTIDSLGAVNGLLTIEKHVGFEVPPRVIRPGGYASFEDMTADLLPKVRAMVARRQSAPRRKEVA
jgi:acyl carrier protein